MENNVLEHFDEFLVCVGISTVALLQIGETRYVVLLGERICRLLRHYNIVAEAVGISRGVAHAHVGMEARHDNGLYAKLTKEHIEVGLEETAVAALGNNIVALREWYDR